MAKSPAFQFYPGDWLSSPRVAMMTPEQEGAYIRLLCYCWGADCSLPDDDETLARLSRLGEGWFKGGSTVIRKCFEPHPNRPGYLVNARLMIEKEKQKAWAEKSAEGGRHSAEKRKKARENAESEQSKGGARVVQPKGNSSSSSSSSSSDNKIPLPLFPENLRTKEFAKSWEEWKKYRKDIKHALVESTESKQLAKCSAIGQERAIAAINHTIEKGWRGLREPETETSEPTDEYRSLHDDEPRVEIFYWWWVRHSYAYRNGPTGGGLLEPGWTLSHPASESEDRVPILKAGWVRDKHGRAVKEVIANV